MPFALVIAWKAAILVHVGDVRGSGVDPDGVGGDMVDETLVEAGPLAVALCEVGLNLGRKFSEPMLHAVPLLVNLEQHLVR